MKRTLAGLAVIIAFAFPLSAAAPRTFVSSTGMDTNPCSRIAPCRSFGAALTQTSAGGSIVALDSAGYGIVTINQSVSIISPEGVYGGITASSATSGITISGTLATDVVALRGLTIEGGGNFAGVILPSPESVGTVYVQRCVISGFSSGIVFTPNNITPRLQVTDTTIFNNSLDGIEVGPSNTHLLVDHCRISGGNIGFWITAAALSTVINTVIDSHSVDGILAQSGQLMTLDHCAISNNNVGITSNTSAAVRVANSTITDNGTGLSTATNGSILTRIGDTTYTVKTNTLENNGTNGAFTGTFTAQ